MIRRRGGGAVLPPSSRIGESCSPFDHEQRTASSFLPSFPSTNVCSFQRPWFLAASFGRSDGVSLRRKNGGGCGRRPTAGVHVSDQSRHRHTEKPRSERGGRSRRNTEEQARSRRGSEMREPELAPALGRFPPSHAMHHVDVPDRVTKCD